MQQGGSTANAHSRGDHAEADVTIVVSVYNQRDFIEDAIKSALDQSVPVVVYVVDDGSTDGSADVAKSLGVPVSVLPHRGAFETFKSGLARVQTPFFSLLGGDDLLDRHFVELTLPHMEDPTVGFVYTGMRWFGAESVDVPAERFDVPRLLWNNYAHASSLTRRAAYQRVGGLDSMFRRGAEDWALWVALVDDGWRGVPVDAPLLKYRRYAAGSRSMRAFGAGQRVRLNLVRRHPRLYARHALSVASVAGRRLVQRLRGRPARV